MDLGFDDLRGLVGAESAGVLRELHWAEFCARLEAAQDLRRVSRDAALAMPGGTGLGSFHRVAAWMLHGAGHHRVGHEDLVNPTSSANGKMEGSTTVMKPNRPSPPRKGAADRREVP
ncbi:hypothetical protein [Novosphingobium sp. SG916]|uniref:hypothetical protein n=1 Tax=Novosphingobium sp. SG916 TaxID=2587131 RepID=UPI001469ABB9|nr:hypothetical protein [Novosphingobium sp. SG916]NKJ42763.1 hypothetical protein [Novosphingobium sp. SG720]NMN88040.1 hypothetical protein [Novosphingobium sp. SG916]